MREETKMNSVEMEEKGRKQKRDEDRNEGRKHYVAVHGCKGSRDVEVMERGNNDVGCGVST